MYDNLVSDIEVIWFVIWLLYFNVDVIWLLLIGWVCGYDDFVIFNWVVWLDEVIIG